jgi:hypothetical protein
MPRTTKNASPALTVVPFRITVVHPLSGVNLMLQRGSNELVPPSGHTPESVSFDFELRLKDDGADSLRWLGDYAQGSPADRFVYVNVGRRAGQRDTAWDRRAKVKLAGISRAQVSAVLATIGSRLEARFEGVGRDGGPSCATVPLLAGWTVIRAAT